METCRQCDSAIIGRTKRAAFCSYACKQTWQLAEFRALTRERLAGRTCIVCSAPITSGSGKARTCSRACGVRWQNEKRSIANRAKWEAEKKPCVRCGQEIGANRRIGVLYCSWFCKHSVTGARWREKSPGYMRRYLYNGFTHEQYVALLEAQDGRCAICRTDTPGGKGGFHLDHDHATGAVRGLLCTNCNMGLGRFADDPARLRAAAEYLI